MIEKNIFNIFIVVIIIIIIQIAIYLSLGFNKNIPQYTNKFPDIN